MAEKVVCEQEKEAEHAFAVSELADNGRRIEVAPSYADMANPPWDQLSTSAAWCRPRWRRPSIPEDLRYRQWLCTVVLLHGRKDHLETSRFQEIDARCCELDQRQRSSHHDR